MWTPQDSLAEIALRHPLTANVFHRHGLDFCCRGELTLEEACAERGLERARVEREMAEAVRDSSDAQLDRLSTPDLISLVERRHHAFLREVLPVTRELAHMVAQEDGGRNQHLPAIVGAVGQLLAHMVPHLEHEEKELFPLLVGAAPDDGRLSEVFDRMMADHRHVSTILHQIRDETEEYRVPEWAGEHYRGLVTQLAALEDDIRRHIYLENHVLRRRFFSGD